MSGDRAACRFLREPGNNAGATPLWRVHLRAGDAFAIASAVHFERVLNSSRVSGVAGHGQTSSRKEKGAETMIDVGYSGAVLIFVVGVATTLSVIAYVVWNYLKLRNKDPFEGE